MSLSGIVEAQAEPFTVFGVTLSLPFILKGQIISFVIFMIAAVAELSRIPFDLPLAESELTMGYLTEYSSMRFTMFFLGEYLGMIAISAVAATLFLGGYWAPWVPESAANFVGPLILLGEGRGPRVPVPVVPLDLATPARRPTPGHGVALAHPDRARQHPRASQRSRWRSDARIPADQPSRSRVCGRACGSR